MASTREELTQRLQTSVYAGDAAGIRACASVINFRGCLAAYDSAARPRVLLLKVCV